MQEEHLCNTILLLHLAHSPSPPVSASPPASAAPESPEEGWSLPDPALVSVPSLLDVLLSLLLVAEPSFLCPPVKAARLKPPSLMMVYFQGYRLLYVISHVMDKGNHALVNVTIRPSEDEEGTLLASS